MRSDSVGPVNWLKVVELGRMVSAPFCGKILADAGAEVIKIEEPPGGDPARSYGPFPGDIPDPEGSGLFLYLNTSKLGITLNFGTATGREVLGGLIAQADVFVTNVELSLLERSKLDPASLKGQFPHLVYAHISPLGGSGPYKEYKAYEINSAALGGAVEQVGHLGMEPLQVPFHLGGYQAGLAAASAILTALLARDITGTGQAIDIAEADVWATLQTGLQFLHYQADGKPTRVPRRVERAFPRSFMRCKDGHMVVSMPQGAQWKRFWEVVGKPEVAADPRYGDRSNLPREAAQELEAIAQPWFMARTKEEIFRLFREASVPITPLMTVADLANSSQETARGFFTQVDRQESGSFTYPGVPYEMSETPIHIRRAAPLLGEHNADIYSGRLGYSAGELAALRQCGVV